MVWEALALASTPSIKGPLRILRKIISSTWHVLVANTVCGRASQSIRVLTEPCVIKFIMIGYATTVTRVIRRKDPLRILRKIISSTWHVLVANTVCGRASQSSRVLTEPCVIEFIMIRQTFMNAKSFFIEYPLRILRKIFSNTRHEFIANAIFRRANK